MWMFVHARALVITHIRNMWGRQTIRPRREFSAISVQELKESTNFGDAQLKTWQSFVSLQLYKQVILFNCNYRVGICALFPDRSKEKSSFIPRQWLQCASSALCMCPETFVLFFSLFGGWPCLNKEGKSIDRRITDRSLSLFILLWTRKRHWRFSFCSSIKDCAAHLSLSRDEFSLPKVGRPRSHFGLMLALP